MFSLSLSCLLTCTSQMPLPPGSAMLVRYSTLKSEDGKHTVQLVTFGFPMTAADDTLLMQVMNSDPYWDYFRRYPVYLKVEDKVFWSGPRLVARSPMAWLRKKNKLPKYGWTTSFALPGDVKLTGAEIKFSWNNDAKPKAQPVKPFATAELTADDLKTATVPFRATVKESGEQDDAKGRREDRHYILFSLNHLPYHREIRVGDTKRWAYARDIDYGPNAKRYRIQQQDELILTFKEAPKGDGALRIQFLDVEGWYKPETVVEKPKEEKK